jgi:hypothetical protein
VFMTPEVPRPELPEMKELLELPPPFDSTRRGAADKAKTGAGEKDRSGPPNQARPDDDE